MKYIHHDLGNLAGGQLVIVTLRGSAANVRLLDSSNLSSYKAGRRHRYYGGLAKRSPVRLQVPHSGHWHVVVDLGGYAGQIRSGVQVLPGPLKPIREQPLSSLPSLVNRDEVISSHSVNEEPCDVFISYASEDNDSFVRPLAEALRSAGLRVWYDEFALRIGDSLRQKIDRGLANSRFGIVVLSQAFFRKGWTSYELDGIVTKAVTGEQVILPIWHNVSKSEVIKYSPSLADKLARNTATHTVDEISEEIADMILEGDSGRSRNRR